MGVKTTMATVPTQDQAYHETDSMDVETTVVSCAKNNGQSTFDEDGMVKPTSNFLRRRSSAASCFSMNHGTNYKKKEY